MDKSLNMGILFLIFNRLDTTQKVFESIREAKPSKLYIASDGARAKKPEEEKIVKEIREYVLSHIDWECEVKTLFREHNLGCRTAVSSAIDWFFENEEMGIILEDDCLPTQSFFRFCQELLEKYKDDTRVMNIAGSNYVDMDLESDYTFSNYTLIWGWATWRRAWKKYNIDMKDFPEFQKYNIIESCFFTNSERRHYLRGFSKMYKNRYNTWDTQWHYTCIKNGYSIIPTKNLIKNIGFGEGATHTMNTEDIHANLDTFELDFPLKDPGFVLPNKRNDLLLFKHSYYLSFFDRVKNLIIRILK